MEKVYSLNGSEYTDYDGLMEEIGEFTCNKQGDEIEVWEGVKQRYNHINLIDIEHLIERTEELAWDVVGDYSEDYLSDLTPELRLSLQRTIANWFDDNVEQPKFYSVTNEKQTTVIYEGD